MIIVATIVFKLSLLQDDMPTALDLARSIWLSLHFEFMVL